MSWRVNRKPGTATVLVGHRRRAGGEILACPRRVAVERIDRLAVQLRSLKEGLIRKQGSSAEPAGAATARKAYEPDTASKEASPLTPSGSTLASPATTGRGTRTKSSSSDRGQRRRSVLPTVHLRWNLTVSAAGES